MLLSTKRDRLLQRRRR